MNRLTLSLACWDYDRVAALMRGDVRAEGVNLLPQSLEVEETFFRVARHAEFDVAEMSLSTYCLMRDRGDDRYIGIPVFPSRFFRHSCIFVNSDSGIKSPPDLVGKRIGVPEYQMTAPVWIRGILSDEYGVDPASMRYFIGGEETPGREEKMRLALPPAFSVTPIGPSDTLSEMIADGGIDALFTARAPGTFLSRPDRVKRLFPDFRTVEEEYYRKTLIFPIMHLIVIRRTVYEQHRWLARSLFKAFSAAQRLAYEELAVSASLKTMLPWQLAERERVIDLMGEDWWSYGIGPNRAVLETFVRYHHAQGLSDRELSVDELFAPELAGSFVI